MIGTTAAILAGSAISGGTSLLGGLFGSKASKKASQQQQDAADAAAKKVEATTAAVNPRIEQAADEGAGWVNQAADYSSGVVTDAAKRAGTGVTDAAGRAIGRVDQATTDANKLLDPYSTAGADATGKLADLGNSEFKFSEDDPSYQWRLQEGQKAIERSAAARGSVMGGAALKALTRYGQGAASTEYAAAFDRFIRSKDSNRAVLSDLASRGLDASGKQGSNLTQAGEYGGNADMKAAEYTGNVNNVAAAYDGSVHNTAAQYGANAHIGAVDQTSQNSINASRTLADILMGKGNAQASGTVGSANAWSSAMSGFGSAAQNIAQWAQLKDLFGGGSNGGVNIGDLDTEIATTPAKKK